MIRIANAPLEGLFDRFAETGLRVCVMRGYEELPNRVENDLDLMLAPSDAPLLRSVLLDFAEDMGLELVGVADHFHVVLIRFLGVDDQGTAWRLIVDEHTRGEGWWGLPYLRNEEVLGDAISCGAWLIPRPAHEAAMALLSHLLIGRRVKVKHLSRLPDLISRDPSEFSRLTTDAFGPRLAARLLRAVLDQDVPGIEGMAWPLRASLAVRSLSSEPQTVAAVARDRLAQARLKAARRGLIVELKGPGAAAQAADVAKATRLVFKDAWFFGSSMKAAPQLAGYGQWLPMGDRVMAGYRASAAVIRERIAFLSQATRFASIAVPLRGGIGPVDTLRRVIEAASRRPECDLGRFALAEKTLPKHP